jgi:hypothetical protein
VKRGAGAIGPGLIVLALAGCAAVPAPAPPPVVAPPRPARAVEGDFALTGRAAQGVLLFGTAPPGTVALLLDGQAIAFATDRRFPIGFGRDHGPEAVLEARLASGDTVRQRIAVAPTAWDIERLPTLPRGTPQTDAARRARADELARIEAARSLTHDVAGWRQAFVWPVKGRISGRFGSQRVYAGEPGAYHSGVDVAGVTGTPVVSPADGVVILASPPAFSFEGNLLMIDHGMGLNSAFLHLSRIDVRVGERISRGQVIGAVGATGRATGPHLHWGMKWRGERIDPQPLADATTLR